MISREFVGESPAITEVRKLMRRVAHSRALAVLIYGETGTGKGLVAEKVHEQSSRARKPFIDVNCASIPGDLFDQELFGQEKGAFTSAILRNNGLINAANGGTLFLDEIPELNHRAQTKLLGLLDRQRFRRTGSVNDVEVDVRFICATNRILFQEVKDGKFRNDLYFRLQVVAINIPPLRERGDDCLVLTEHFIKKFNRRYDRTVKGWEPAIAEIFRDFNWPGNVRELENLLERIFVLETDDRILVKQIPPRIMRELEDGTGAPKAVADGNFANKSFQDATSEFQISIIQNALTRSSGKLTVAAEILGLSRHALRHQMNKLHMR
ncbi:MAG: Fis family transcriptional regulator [Marinosulfonomonas sp.]|nr:MAG: Fis family transcriptional regulator [Marinosulfonomonas sp.]